MEFDGTPRDVARDQAHGLREAAGPEDATLTVSADHGWHSITARAVRNSSVDVPHSAFAGLAGTYRVRLHADGRYEFSAGGAMFAQWIVLDPDFRYPGHPLPGMPRPAAATPSAAPVDPAVFAEVSRLCQEFAAHYQRIKGTPPPWPAGCRETDLAAAEARIGARLPEDLRALYLIANGDPEEPGLLGRYSHDPLARVVGSYQEGAPGSYGWEDAVSDAGVVFEPAPRGRAGQVLAYGRDTDGPLRYVAPSATEMIREVVTALNEAVTRTTPTSRSWKPRPNRSNSATTTNC